jgi:hypothetical protein
VGVGDGVGIGVGVGEGVGIGVGVGEGIGVGDGVGVGCAAGTTENKIDSVWKLPEPSQFVDVAPPGLSVASPVHVIDPVA